MNNPLVTIPAIINLIVIGLFAGFVLRQYLMRRKPYQLYWSMGLLMALFATLSYIGMILAVPTTLAGMLFFRLYYILGILTPAWLGLGSFALISGRRTTLISLTLLYLLSALATVLLFFAQINEQKLALIHGSGEGIFIPGPWLALVIILNTLGVIAVVGVAAYSGWKLWRRQTSMAGFQTRNILVANVLILIGDMLNALAGTLARVLQVESTFWLIMAVGWSVFFVGVLYTSRRPRVMTTPETDKTLVNV